MQYAARVGERNCVTDAEKNPQTVRERGDGFNVFVQPLPFHKFHGVEHAAVRQSSHVVNGHNARMLESSQHTGLANQPVCEIAVCSGEVEYFQGHAPPEVFVLRGIHHTPAPARDTIEQSITRAREVWLISALTQSFERAVRKEFHFASQPNAARASRWNSSSLPQSSRRRSSAIFRNSRRAHASALVTSVTEIPYSFESCWYEIFSPPSRSYASNR